MEMNRMKEHSTSDKHLVIFDATDAVVAEARKLEQSGRTKVQNNGAVIIHINLRSRFERIIENEAKAHHEETEIAPVFDSYEQIEAWAWENVNSSKLADYITKFSPRVWNAEVAGKTVAEVNDLVY